MEEKFLELYRKLSPYPIFRNNPISDNLYYKQYLGRRLATDIPLVKSIWGTGSLASVGDPMKLNVNIILTDGTRKEFSGDDVDSVYKETELYLSTLK